MAESTDRKETTKEGVSRRKAMMVTGAAVAGAGALMAAPFRDQIQAAARKAMVSTGVGRRILSLADGTYEEWMGEVGSTFALGGQSSIRLVGVRPLRSGGRGPQGVRTQGFAAFFEPVGGQTLAPDLIYTANHPAYGPLPLYLGAAGTGRAPGRMVAVFS
ncbi:MAG TPA: hypothetical protein VEC11_12650 [Allosphingosinicella sp.]|nr:hypothetical protein [Allosphingosinicella sp.]